MDGEIKEELEVWNESMRAKAITFCQENGFNIGFFEGGDNRDNRTAMDNYELKVMGL